MSFEVVGTLHKVFDTVSKTEKFQAREFVLLQPGNYPQYVKFQLTQDRCELISQYKEGDEVKVFFDLRGREWNGSYFTNLNAWKIEKPATTIPEPVGAPEPASTSESGFPSIDDAPKTTDEIDDLPF